MHPDKITRKIQDIYSNCLFVWNSLLHLYHLIPGDPVSATQQWRMWNECKKIVSLHIQKASGHTEWIMRSIVGDILSRSRVETRQIRVKQDEVREWDPPLPERCIVQIQWIIWIIWYPKCRLLIGYVGNGLPRAAKWLSNAPLEGSRCIASLWSRPAIPKWPPTRSQSPADLISLPLIASAPIRLHLLWSVEPLNHLLTYHLIDSLSLLNTKKVATFLVTKNSPWSEVLAPNSDAIWFAAKDKERHHERKQAV
jgi:hypothetical protein